MKKKLAVTSGVVAAVILGWPWAAEVAAAEKPDAEEAVVEMREVSAFNKGDVNRGRMLTRGQYAECSTEPDKEVKAYPKLKSKRPLYGRLSFDRSISNRKGIEFRFVLDESGEAPPSDEKAEEKAQEKKPGESLLQSLAEKLAGAVGKSEPERGSPLLKARLSSYDRLYVDLNRDLDLTNDPVLKPMKDPPWQALPPWEVREKAAFEYLNVDVDYGPEVGVRPFRIFPWFSSSEQGGRTYDMMYFVAPVAREGSIRMGTHEYDALLAQAYLVTGRFDRSATALYLSPKDSREKLGSSGFRCRTREIQPSGHGRSRVARRWSARRLPTPGSSPGAAGSRACRLTSRRSSVW